MRRGHTWLNRHTAGLDQGPAGLLGEDDPVEVGGVLVEAVLGVGGNCLRRHGVLPSFADSANKFDDEDFNPGDTMLFHEQSTWYWIHFLPSGPQLFGDLTAVAIASFWLDELKKLLPHN